MNTAKIERVLRNILEEFYPNWFVIKIHEIEKQIDSWIVKAEVFDNPSMRQGHEVILTIRKYEIT